MEQMQIGIRCYSGSCLVVICWTLLAIVGCQNKPTTVKGLVTLDGKPLAMHEGMRGTVVFQPTATQGTTLSGVIDTQGRYELAVGTNYSVTPSVYWATVSAMEIVPPSEELPQPSGRRITPAKYASATDSGFRIEVMPGENEIDLAMISEAKPPIAVEPADVLSTEQMEPVAPKANSIEVAPEKIKTPEKIIKGKS